MFDWGLLEKRLVAEEGLKLTPYVDTRGNWTIGVGHKLSGPSSSSISEQEAYAILSNDLDQTVEELNDQLSWWTSLDPVRQLVLVDMAFELGVVGLLAFKNTLVLIQKGNYAAASAGMLASAWSKEVPNRATQLAKIMETGVYEPYR